MKRIVILCDGTWNAAEAEHPTNVVRLGQALAGVGIDGRDQVPVYVEGVGTGRRGVTGFSRLTDRILGGALGLGLLDNVVEAYRHLVFLYEPGDEIYAFGFSRGAFTARSLIGFLRFTGLLARADLHRLPRAVERYTERRIESPERRQRRNAEWRARYSPHMMTDPDDAEVYAEYGSTQAIPLDVAFLGVWDTVGSLGIPGHLTAAPIFNRRFAFHDTTLSPMVRSARHAVAIDEPRRSFRPTLWTNLDTLNEGREGTPYRQAHLPGDHGSVGGGGDITGLSSIALSWMIEGAEDAGLDFDPRVKAALAEEANAETAFLMNRTFPPGGVAALMRAFGSPRDPVERFDDVGDAARLRWAHQGTGPGFRPYRPEPLRGLERELREWSTSRDS